MCVNKSDLVDDIAMKIGTLPRHTVDIGVSMIIDLMSETLAKGERIEIRGFGSFQVKTYKPRMSRNPKSGEKLSIEARKRPTFKPGKELREKVTATL